MPFFLLAFAKTHLVSSKGDRTADSAGRSTVVAYQINCNVRVAEWMDFATNKCLT